MLDLFLAFNLDFFLAFDHCSDINYCLLINFVMGCDNFLKAGFGFVI